MQSFRLLEDDDVLRQASWLLGEFCVEPDQIEQFVDAVKCSLGEVRCNIGEVALFTKGSMNAYRPGVSVQIQLLFYSR